MVILRKLCLVILLLIVGCSNSSERNSKTIQKSPALAASSAATKAIVPASSKTTDWINVASSEDGIFVDFDAESVKYSDQLVAYRLRLRLPRSNETGISMYGSEQLMDCASGAYQDMKVLGFNEQGELVFDKQDGLDAPIQDSKIGSAQEYIHKYVCRANEPLSPSEIQVMRAYQERIRQNDEFVNELMKLYSSRKDPCDYSWQTDAIGQQCGDRAASERPGGR